MNHFAYRWAWVTTTKRTLRMYAAVCTLFLTRCAFNGTCFGAGMAAYQCLCTLFIAAENEIRR